MEQADQNPAQLVRSASWLRSVLTALLAFLAIILLAERLSYAGLFDGTFQIGKLPAQIVFALPSVFYLIAVWHFRSSAEAVSLGQPFGTVVAQALRRAGAFLIVGAMATLVMPLVYVAFGEFYPRLIEFDVATLIVAGIGLAMLFFGRLLDRARELQDELEEFF